MKCMCMAWRDISTYQHVREDNETGMVPQDMEAQKRLFYAAYAFIYMSQTIKVSMMMGEKKVLTNSHKGIMELTLICTLAATQQIWDL